MNHKKRGKICMPKVALVGYLLSARKAKCSSAVDKNYSMTS
jgi:hypothetical protein